VSSGPSDPIVLDASAILAVIQDEAGTDALRSLETVPLVSAINLVEVHAVMARAGVTSDVIRATLARLRLEVLPFAPTLVEGAAEIHARGRKRGLSLGDAACLATARAIGGEAWTADSAWRGLDVGVRIRLIR